MEHSRPKITIDPDGTIHVDDEEKPAVSSRAKSNQNDNVHASHANAHVSNQAKTHHTVRYKTAEQITREMAAANHAPRQAVPKHKAQPAQPPHKAVAYFWGFAFTMGVIAIPFGLLTGAFPLAACGAAAILISLLATKRHRDRS
ncbi:hypothetical protein [Collinsella intestinalis]|uniref:hypothetical protein n=1 Tax=Collinsella intestinalis TaxID=147207 RepID=UPI0025A3DCA0|nr:hypothetical protein [Collinsella intestinalis]MDM8164130.1 hypothetical protein [Collinsella intestinalis]